MKKVQDTDTHRDYILIEQLLRNFDIWNHPSKDQEAGFREYMRDIIVGRVLGSKSDFDVKYGRNIDKQELEPKRFQSTRKVEIKKPDNRDEIYKISVCISDINVNPSDRVNLYFDGIISKMNGIESDKPITIRRG